MGTGGTPRVPFYRTSHTHSTLIHAIRERLRVWQLKKGNAELCNNDRQYLLTALTAAENYIFDLEELPVSIPVGAPWLVVINREGTSEVTVFTEEKTAREYFASASLQWSESYLTRAIEFPKDWVGTP